MVEESKIAKTYLLNNGMEMPILGLGTYPIKETEVFE